MLTRAHFTTIRLRPFPLLLLMGLFISGFFIWLQPDRVQAGVVTDSHILFLPIVMHHDNTICHLNAQEERIAQLLLTHVQQKRQQLRCHPILAQVARSRAEDLGTYNYFSHINHQGYGPNYLVQAASYRLPQEYSQAVDGNNIESLGAGPDNADSMWGAWANSDKHRVHLLGLNEFFVEQIDYGIGFARVPSSDYQYYWVVIIARPGQ